MQNILEFLDTKYIDWTIFLIVIASGFLQQRLLSPFVWYRKDARYDQTIKTLAVSVVFCFLYIWLYKYELNGASEADKVEAVPFLKFFLSFGLATSFYDIIIRLFKIELKKKTGIDTDEK